MLHLFVETNWVVDFAAPAFRRTRAAQDLVEEAKSGKLRLHLPSLCLAEARKVILNKFQPREADVVRDFIRWALANGQIEASARDTVLDTIKLFEDDVKHDLNDLDNVFSRLRNTNGVDVYPLEDEQLKLAIDIGATTTLNPFDQSVLAAVLGRADSIRATDPSAEFAFCERDGDLQPWDKNGNGRRELLEL